MLLIINISSFLKEISIIKYNLSSNKTKSLYCHFNIAYSCKSCKDAAGKSNQSHLVFAVLTVHGTNHRTYGRLLTLHFKIPNSEFIFACVASRCETRTIWTGYLFLTKATITHTVSMHTHTHAHITPYMFIHTHL